jgi:hypothetical protein
MSVKIPSGPPEGAAAEAVGDAAGAVEGAEKASAAEAAGPAAADEIQRIAEQVAAGEIGREEAIRRIVGDVLQMDIVKDAPAEVGAELTEVLEALVETDPRLSSLAAMLGPKGSD